MGSTVADAPQVVVLGDVAVDWAIEVAGLPDRDSLVLARSCKRFPGGSAANVAVGLARLGYRVGFVGQVGDDESGRFLLKAFEREGVDTRDTVTLARYETPACLVVVEDGGDHMIIVLPRDSDVHRLHDPDLSRVAEAEAIHIGPSHTEVARRAAVRARENDALVFYAPGGLARAVGRGELWPVLELADGLIVSCSEAFALTDRSTPEDAARALLDAGPAVVVETTGVEGALIATGDGLCRVPALPVPDTRDTTGAGDAFAAGFIGARLRGFDWNAAAHIGSTAAALKIRHLGARTGLPGWEEVLSAAPPRLSDGRYPQRRDHADLT
jgi:ribokinase